MKNLFLVAVMVAGSTGWAAAGRPGIVLRMEGKVVNQNFNGTMPEFRLMSNGVELNGTCGAKTQRCDLKEIGRLSPTEMRGIQEKVEAARSGRVERWISGARCFRAPDFSRRYTAGNGSIILKTGHICLGGGLKNISQSATELVEFITQESARN
ncbi:MAG: hypothetical protein HYR96_01980 [Deltaproteobacteria bacterium]|nr:hypothetical protein [Deltaproteobacteria bacterium]MBI3295638.1 hypothetical protein [Deltaproteobacteria bacterium]